MQRLTGFWRTYWTRGVPGRETPRSLAVFMQRMWLLALLFKLLGSSWDVSWHMKWLRDDLAPPHDINTVGTGIAIALVLAHTFTGYGAEKRSLRIMQWGTGIFVVAGPIDVVNHRVNGLDLTAWSPSHMLLYTGTFIMVVGVIRNWYRTYPRDGKLAWQYPAGLLVLFTFLFEDAWFPTGQQEYGIFEVSSWFHGTPEAEPSLLNFAANQIGRPVDDTAVHHFAMPIASWVYPVWTLAVCVIILVLARTFVRWRFTATLVVAIYVAYRCLIWPIFAATGFGVSALPLWVVPVGVAVDGAFWALAKPYVRSVVGAVVVSAVGFGALAFACLITDTPLSIGTDDMAQWRSAFEGGANLLTVPVAWWSAAITVPGLIVTWAITTYAVRRFTGSFDPHHPKPTVNWAVEPPRDARKVLLGGDTKSRDQAGSDSADTLSPR